ncbi:MAG: hypothetical protein AVDCRST_MAG49-2646, partial [uncultured Thermomicrobiales bacterium]
GARAGRSWEGATTTTVRFGPFSAPHTGSGRTVLAVSPASCSFPAARPRAAV